MLRKQFDREPRSGRSIAAVALLAALAAAAPARAAEGLWDAVMEKMNLKAAPAAPGPAFVEHTRPDPSTLGYMPTARPHKVSPVPVKSAAEIQAQKDALDAAAKRQSDPAPAKPLELPKGAKPAKAKPAAAAAVAD